MLGVVALATAVLVVLGGRPVLAKSCIQPSAVNTVRGTLVGNEPADLFAGDTHHIIELDTIDVPARFLVFGKPDRLEIGGTYEAEVYTFDETGSDALPFAWLHGDNLCGPDTSILAVNDDGSTSAIDRYPGLGLPISRSEFLVGFGVFALVVYIFSRLTT